jgi:XTP/dITP diphosphohydrolase
MQKNKKILIGTHNLGKFKELSFLVAKNLKKISPIQLKLISPKETGKTFLANSKLKANFFFKETNIMSLSDDSGLCVDCLKNKPGIYSARWAKKYGSFKKAMKKIIKLVDEKNKNKKKKNYKAKFVCSLTLKVSKKKTINSTGVIYGNISRKILGKNGFGYDPIFIPKNYNVTFGQMNKRKKILIDHRYLAFIKLKQKISFL